MDVFTLTSRLTLDTSEYESKLKAARSQAGIFHSGFSSIGVGFSGITSGISGIISGFSQASDKVSLFGEMLKSSLAGEAITKSIEMISSGIQSATSELVNFAKESISVGMSFESGMSQVAATMGTTTDQIQELTEFAKEMGATTAFSAGQAAEALNYMALAGYDAQTSMDMLPNVLNLAAAGGIELGYASDMVTDAASALGLTLENGAVNAELVTKMVDEMAKAASSSNTSVEQLGEAILTIGGTAKNMYGGTEQIAMVLGVMADNGIKGSEAGTHLRNVLTKLASPTKEAQELFEKLGVSAFDSEGKMKDFAEFFPQLRDAMAGMTDQERMSAISTLFNARDQATVEALMATTESRWAELGAKIADAEGSAGQMAKTQLDNLAGDKTLFNSAKEGLQIAISGVFDELARDIVQTNTKIIEVFTNSIKNKGVKDLSQPISHAITTISQFIRKQAPGFIDSGMALIKNVVLGFRTGGSDIRKAVKSIAEAFVTAWKNNKMSFEMGGVIKNIIKSLTNGIPNVMKATAKVKTALIKSLTNPDNISKLILSGFSIITAIAQGISENLTVILDETPEIIENIKQGLGKSSDEIKKSAPEILEKLAESLKNLKSAFDKNAPEIVKNIANAIMNAPSEMSKTAESIIKSFAKALAVNDWKDVKGSVSDSLKSLDLATIVSEIDFSKITSTLSKLIIGVTDLAGNVIDGIDWSVIGSAIGEALNGIDYYGILKSLLKVVTTTITNAPELLKGIAESIDDGVAGQFEIIGGGALIGKYAVSKIAEVLAESETFAQISTALSGVFADCAPVIGAAIAGWGIGTLIRNEIFGADNVDEFWAVFVDSAKEAGYEIKALWNWLFKNKGGLSYKQIYNNIALDATASGAGFQTESYRKELLELGNGDIYENFGNENGVNFDDFQNQIQEKLDAVRFLYEGTAESIGNATENVKAKREEFVNILSGSADSKSPEQSGKDMMGLFAKGIADNAGEPKKAITDFTQWTSDNIGFSVPKMGALSNADTYMPDMMKLFANGINSNAYLIRNEINTIANIINQKFTSLDSFSWGYDMMINFQNGINAAWAGFIQSIQNIANTIHDYLGFSEPKKGALSNFHTYAPDMMNLFASGIRDNTSVLESQLQDTSSRISNAISGDYTGSYQIPVQSYAGSNQTVSSSPVQVQTLEINISGAEFASDYDVEKFVDKLIPTIQERLDVREKWQQRGKGGAGFGY